MRVVRKNVQEILEIALWCAFIINSIFVIISQTQIFKDIFYYLAASAIIAVVLVFRQSNVFKWYIIIGGIVYAGIILAYIYLHKSDFGIHYALYICAKMMMYGMFVIFLIIRIIEREKYNLRFSISSKFFIVSAVAFLIAFIISFKYISIIFCPIIAWYLAAMNHEEWERRMLLLSRGSYISFVIMVMASVILKPKRFVEGRYIGIFFFPVAAGLISVIGILAVIYHWKVVKYSGQSNRKSFIIHVALVLPPFAFLIVTANRSSLVGILFVLFALFVFKDKNKKGIKKRFIITMVSAFVLFLTLVATIKYMLDTDKEIANVERFWTGEQDFYLKRAFDFAIYMGREESYTGVFEKGTVMNVLDVFSSNRFGLWCSGLKQVTAWGREDVSVLLPNGESFGHVHSTYIFWLMRLGVIGGGAILIWFLSLAFVSFRNEAESDRHISYLTLWVAFCLGFFVFERVNWSELALLMLLLLQNRYLFSDRLEAGENGKI